MKAMVTDVGFFDHERISEEGTSDKFSLRPCAFFSMFLVTFFSPNLRGRAEKKQNVQRKKTHWLSVPDHLTSK